MGSSANPEPTGGTQPPATEPPAGSGVGTGSEPNTPSAGASSPSTPTGLDRSRLNPVLRSMNEDELNDVFDTLLQSVRQAPAQQQVQAPTPPPQEPDYKELLDPNSESFNPKAAFQSFVQQNYGTLLGDINQRSMNAVFLNMAAQFPDFKEHENDVRTVLRQRDPATLTEADVLGTYYAVKGAKHTNELLKKKREAAAAGTVTGTPSPPKDEVPTVQISPTEEQVAKRMFPRASDPVAEYKKYLKRDTEGFEMKVPIGGGKFA